MDQSQPTGPHHFLYQIIMSMSHNLNAKFIRQLFGNASRQHILQMAKLVIYKLLPKSIPEIYHPCRAYYISMGPILPRYPNVYS